MDRLFHLLHSIDRIRSSEYSGGRTSAKQFAEHDSRCGLTVYVTVNIGAVWQCDAADQQKKRARLPCSSSKGIAPAKHHSSSNARLVLCQRQKSGLVVVAVVDEATSPAIRRLNGTRYLVHYPNFKVW